MILLKLYLKCRIFIRKEDNNYIIVNLNSNKLWSAVNNKIYCKNNDIPIKNIDGNYTKEYFKILKLIPMMNLNESIVIIM